MIVAPEPKISGAGAVHGETDHLIAGLFDNVAILLLSWTWRSLKRRGRGEKGTFTQFVISSKHFLINCWQTPDYEPRSHTLDSSRCQKATALKLLAATNQKCQFPKLESLNQA